jgi:uncharacterized iron-regulated membrane protein
MSCIGLLLAWPRSLPQLRRLLRVRTHSSLAHFNLDVHRLTGLLAAPVLVTVLATGIALNLSPQATGLLQRFSPLTFEPPLPPRQSAPAGTGVATSGIGWQAALDATRRAQPGARPFSLYRDASRQVYVARMREPGAIHRRGQTRVYVDAHDGGVLTAWNPRDGSAGDWLWAWQNPLHSGHACGGIGRALVFLGGLAALLFVVTGVPLWLARRRRTY